ncbi:hypothetical protein [Lentzea sp. NBRC 102530]|uniref:hypothetical protein n=1 Tax=Lentzea sp. NBRC 102530 TaxID=3032201 RepID=UPI0024A51CAA|nr:hypothetical protein [Lentzea sp. NBRC 102530]GLY47273.1 hypothetical protein Lesp01_09290 [Lentzea sp. NBRC 102530]
MISEQLAVLCERLADSAGGVRASPRMAALAESIAGRVRAGAEPADVADDFDALEEMLLQAGHAAGLSPVRSYDRLPGAGDGHRVLEVLRCPGGSCPRVELPGARPVPCAVHLKPMVVQRLPS